MFRALKVLQQNDSGTEMCLYKNLQRVYCNMHSSKNTSVLSMGVFCLSRQCDFILEKWKLLTKHVQHRGDIPHLAFTDVSKQSPSFTI